MTEAMVTPSLLTWARNRRGVEVFDLASKLNVKPEALVAWEAGEMGPTFRQAQRLARALYVPFGYLYLEEPPVEKLPLYDYRATPEQPLIEPSPDLLDLLNEVLGKQQWFREYREAEGIEELPFVGRFSITDSEETVAADIRNVIDVDGTRERATQWEGFMRRIAANAERAGILVMRSSVVGNSNRRPLNTEEFRSFSVSDHVAPLIFINGRDHRIAQGLTFAHEMAHIWIGNGGISNPDYGVRQTQQHSHAEEFCSRVAVETLLPGEDFRSRWIPTYSPLEDNLRDLSRHYKVSPLVVLRQAYVHDFLSDSEYEHCYSQLIEQEFKARETGVSGGAFSYIFVARHGPAFTEAVISSASEGTLSSRDAADMLGVKVKSLANIAEQFFGSPMNLA